MTTGSTGHTDVHEQLCLGVPKCFSCHKAIMLTRRTCSVKIVWSLSIWVFCFVSPHSSSNIYIYIYIYCVYIICYDILWYYYDIYYVIYITYFVYYIYIWYWKMKSSYNERLKFFSLKIGLPNFEWCRKLYSSENLVAEI